jgi:hypothetical protein
MENLDLIRDRLLELHRLVLDEARSRYEREHGKTTAGEFLDVLVEDPELAWLRPFTSLIVELDDEEVIATDLDRSVWKGRARELLRPDAEGGDFQRHYDEVVQRSPDVVLAHGEAMRALKAD